MTYPVQLPYEPQNSKSKSQNNEIYNINLEVRCEYRLHLYKDELNKAFNKIVEISNPPSFNKIRKAIRDCELFQELADLLDAFVVPGVQADIQKNSQKNSRAFPKNLSEDNQFSMYKDYAKTFTLQDGFQEFFNRNPLCRHAVKKIAENFIANLQSFSERLLKDWESINECFFQGKVQELVKIRTTGSDFHKGGKQVLILTFQLEEDLIRDRLIESGEKKSYGRYEKKKLVYKPSDVEVDFRLVGDVDAVKKHLPREFFISKSFAELINDFVRDDSPLLTYKILPVNPGSLLEYNTDSPGRKHDGEQVLPIRESYGYIEYLEHKPEHLMLKNNPTENDLLAKANSLTQELTAQELKDSDWITTDERDAQKYWKTLGKLWAMLTVCGCTDMHRQNFRVYKKRPQVIDLEDAFKKRFKQYSETGLQNSDFDRYDDPGSKSPAVFNDKTVDIFMGFCNPAERDKDKEYAFSLNHLVVHPPERSAFVAKREMYFEQASKGFAETMHAFREPTNNDAISSWLANAKNMVVRYVPLPTSTLANHLRAIFSPVYVRNQVPSTSEESSYINFFSYEGVLKTEKIYILRAFNVYTREINPYKSKESDDPWSSTPILSIFHPKHNFYDFLNLDVPSYYHRLSDCHLLNSRGMRVIPEETWGWLYTNLKKYSVDPLEVPNKAEDSSQNIGYVNRSTNSTGLESKKEPESIKETKSIKEPKKGDFSLTYLEHITGRSVGSASYQPMKKLTTFFPDTPFNLFQQVFEEFKEWDDKTFQEFVINNLKLMSKGRKNPEQDVSIIVKDDTEYTISKPLKEAVSGVDSSRVNEGPFAGVIAGGARVDYPWDKVEDLIIATKLLGKSIEDRKASLLETKPLLETKSSEVSRQMNFSSEFISTAAESISLNGMKVIFDQSALVYPVTLEPKNK